MKRGLRSLGLGNLGIGGVVPAVPVLAKTSSGSQKRAQHIARNRAISSSTLSSGSSHASQSQEQQELPVSPASASATTHSSISQMAMDQDNNNNNDPSNSNCFGQDMMNAQGNGMEAIEDDLTSRASSSVVSFPSTNADSVMWSQTGNSTVVFPLQSGIISRCSSNGSSLPVPATVSIASPQITKEQILLFPKTFTDAFNIGDYEGVASILTKFVAEDCMLRTPALSQEVSGRSIVMK